MITCPNCQKPVSGTARSCGYCGMSIVEDYFHSEGRATTQYPSLHPGTIIASILGIFAALAAGLAAVAQMLFIFQNALPYPDTLFWVRAVLMIVFAVFYLAQQCVLRGLRFSMLFDCTWLFISACALGFALQGFAKEGAGAFYGSGATTFLLIGGCALGLLASVTGILTYRKPE